ncbi:unnamed protein product [Hymenolepis diminuta]|uniref:Uncharacterized protein n=1 Tax=Hymenolepis diminuta TaxID=6216 RepID=A0A564ZAW7_HYMDI|nr:unnamed protein product [Hymenolepis diminuta]
MRALIGRDDCRKRKGQCRQDWLITKPTKLCLCYYRPRYAYLLRSMKIGQLRTHDVCL